MTFKTTKQNLYGKRVVTSTPDFQIFLCGMMMAGISLAPQCHPMKWVLFYCPHFADEETWPLRTLRLWVTLFEMAEVRIKTRAFWSESTCLTLTPSRLSLQCLVMSWSQKKKKTKITSDCPKLIMLLTGQHLPWQKSRWGSSQSKEPPQRLLGAPLHDLFGLEPSQITDNLTYKNLKISQQTIRW